MWDEITYPFLNFNTGLGFRQKHTLLHFITIVFEQRFINAKYVDNVLSND